MLRWRMEFEGMRVLRRAALAQDDGRNLMAFPVHPVILSERSESKNPYLF